MSRLDRDRRDYDLGRISWQDLKALERRFGPDTERTGATRRRVEQPLAVGSRVVISGEAHPWYGEVGSVSEGEHYMRIAGRDDPEPWVCVKLDAGEECGAHVSEVQPIPGRARR